MGNLRKFAVLVSLALLSACGCGSNQDSVAAIQALPPERLNQLATDLIAAEARSTASKRYDERTGIPAAFQDLDPKEVVVDPIAGSRIYLSGCFDDKALIVMRGLGRDRHMMVLLPGEVQPEVVLWESE